MEDPWGGGCVTLTGVENEKARKWYAANQMPVLAYSSLARGLFSGRITPENFEEMKSTLDQACLTAYCHPENLQRLGRAIELAEERDVQVPQVVLAYLLASHMNVFPLVGAANPEEYANNLRAFDIQLTPKESAWLNLAADSR
jgi:aryl-alcohol dehydrogenase-like predicted oxidoreductase